MELNPELLCLIMYLKESEEEKHQELNNFCCLLTVKCESYASAGITLVFVTIGIQNYFNMDVIYCRLQC